MSSPIAAAEPEVFRWKAVCAYDGTAFAGWQSQAGGNAIQDVIERRLAEILGRDIRIFGSGRTDAGVHARGQVFHFDAAWRHSPEKLIAAFRVGLPPAIQVRSVRRVSGQFHARLDASGKIYIYQIHAGAADPFHNYYMWSVFRPLDLHAMRAAAAVLRGRHDFRAFTALNGADREDTVRDVRRIDVTRRGARWKVTIEGEGFLYKMARSIVGVLVSVGEGKLAAEDVRKILASRERTERVLTAPPHGLFLEKVLYR